MNDHLFTFELEKEKKKNIRKNKDTIKYKKK